MTNTPKGRENSRKTVAVDLHHAVALGRSERVHELLESGEDAGIKDSHGQIPLHSACQQGHAEITQDLLNHGSPVDIQDANGNTPLFNAVFGSQPSRMDIVHALLEAGSDPDLKNYHGVSPRDVANNFHKKDILHAFDTYAAKK